MIVASTDRGFQLWTPSSTSDPRRIVNDAVGAVQYAWVVEDTNMIVLLVNGGKTVQLYDWRQKQALTEVVFETPALKVKATKHRMVVVFDKCLHLFDMETMTPLPQIRTTRPLNKLGLCELAGDDHSTWLAFPQSSDKDDSRGDCIVMDAMKLDKMPVIPAHQTPIHNLAFNKNGSVLATASARGSVIRVFSNPNSQLLHTLRRGNTEAIIQSIFIAPLGDMLMVTSNTNTIHVWKLQPEASSNSLNVLKTKEETSWRKYDVDTKGCRTLSGISPDCQSVYVGLYAGPQVNLLRFATSQEKDKGTPCGTIQ
jgi:autophagy-related protein 18